MVIVIVGVMFLVWNANRLYGSLYGRLTEVEVQASRIERDLGDPARLLTELASDGLDISSIINQPRSTTAAAGDASESAVINWDGDVGALMEPEDDISEPISEPEQIQETDSLLESESLPEFSDIDPLAISTNIVPEEEAPSLDVSDLFGDETAEVRDDV